MAIAFALFYLGFPAFVAVTLIADGTVEYHWPSFVLGVLSVLLMAVVGVYGWMLWTGRVQQKGSSHV